MNRFAATLLALFAAATVASGVVIGEPASSSAFLDGAVVRAEASASPEAMPDPMGISMYVVPVGASTGPKMMLSGSASICRTEYADGFTIQCMDPAASGMQFVINGDTVKSENAMPYFIAGDKGGVPNAWTTYPAAGTPFTLACKPGNGERLQVSITITC